MGLPVQSGPRAACREVDSRDRPYRSFDLTADIGSTCDAVETVHQVSRVARSARSAAGPDAPDVPIDLAPAAPRRIPAVHVEVPDDTLRMIAEFFKPSADGMRPGISFVSYPVLMGADNDPALRGAVMRF